MLTYICVHCRYNLQNVWQICKTLKASASRNYNSTLFYHPKKLLYHYIIPFYNTTNIPKFYFPILLLKIIYLHNKIIYPKTQIKTKTQITTCYHHDHEQPSTHQPITDPKPINNHSIDQTHHQSKPINPTNPTASKKKT